MQRPLEVPLPTPAENFLSPARSIRSRSVNDTPIARHCESATSGRHPESLLRDDAGDIDYGGYDGDVPDYEVSFPRSLDAIISHNDNTDVFVAGEAKGVAVENHRADHPASDCSKSNASAVSGERDHPDISDHADAYSPTKGDCRSKRARTQSSAEQKEKNRNYARATDFRKVTKLDKVSIGGTIPVLHSIDIQMSILTLLTTAYKLPIRSGQLHGLGTRGMQVQIRDICCRPARVSGESYQSNDRSISSSGYAISQ